MKKYFACSFAKIALLPIFLSLSTHNALASSTNTPLQKTFVVVAPWEISNADPSQSGMLFQRMQLAETLVDVDEKGHLVPALAERWEADNDAKVWTFTLRPEVVFHDGTVMTAKDVVNSLQISLTKPTLLNKIGIETITAPDERTVVISLKKGLRSFPAFLTHYTAIILAPSSYQQQKVSSIVGTGPFKLQHLEPPQSFTATRFDQYWGKKALITHAKYLATSRSESRALMAESDDHYIVYNLDAASVNRLQRHPNLQLHTKSITRTIQLKMNVANPLFDEVTEREVLSDAIHRQGITHAVLRFQQGEADQILPPSFNDWRIQTNSTPPDYQALRQKLIRIGYKLNSDQILEKDGKPLKFTLKTFSDRPELPLIATALQYQWKQLGADVQVSIGNFSEIPAGHHDGTLEMALYARHYGTLPDPMGVLLQDFAPTGSDWGVMNWHDDGLTQALTDLATETDPAKIAQLKQQVSTIIYSQKPIIPIVYYQQNAVAHKKLKGLRLDPFERSFHLNELGWEDAE